jgi:hypothetical protein
MRATIRVARRFQQKWEPVLRPNARHKKSGAARKRQAAIFRRSPDAERSEGDPGSKLEHGPRLSRFALGRGAIWVTTGRYSKVNAAFMVFAH